MGIIQRLRQLWKSHRAPVTDEELVAALSRLRESIDTILTQAGVEVAGCLEEEHRLASLMDAEECRANRILCHARQALNSGQEQAASRAMREYLLALRQAEHYRIQWSRQYQGTQRLQLLLEKLNLKRVEIEHRQQMLSHYRQLAAAQQALTIGLAGGVGQELIEQAESAITNGDLTLNAYQQLRCEDIDFNIEMQDTSTLTDQINLTLARLRSELNPPCTEQ